MRAYYIISYDIEDMQTFRRYPPLAVPLIHEFGGEVLVSDTEAYAVEGEAKKMNAIIVFPSREAALACYNDPRYREVMQLRIKSTSNRSLILAKEFS
jgi:uncharacterized protein (DUF1330 family)